MLCSCKANGENGSGHRNWASVVISLSIISLVLLMVTLATLLMGPQDPPFFGRRLLLGDLYDLALRPEPTPYQWMRGTANTLFNFHLLRTLVTDQYDVNVEPVGVELEHNL